MPNLLKTQLSSAERMLLLIAFTFVDFAFSFRTETVCYGSSHNLPIPVDKNMYYQPRNGERILVASNGKVSNHTRFWQSSRSLQIKAMTEQDNGAKLFIGQSDTITFEVADCQERDWNKYGDLFSWRVPSGAEYLEFSQVNPQGIARKPRVLWNRVKGTAGKGSVNRNYYEFSDLKQEDNGYYKFVGAKGYILKWKRIEVKEHEQHYQCTEGETLDMDFPVSYTASHVLFTPEGMEDVDFNVLNDRDMARRMILKEYHFSYRGLTHGDAGTYKFIDEDGFLVVRLELEVHPRELPTWAYIVGVVIVFICVMCCCCCVRKCCCKKSSSKRNAPATEAAAPPVYNHGPAQPTQPAAPLLETEPREPPAYRAVFDLMDRRQPTQVSVPEGLGRASTPEIPPSSDLGPRFEFKGSAFPSAPPLSSGSSIQDVYTSDKLNFL